MKTRNLLDKSFGPVGTSAGIFIFFAGLLATFNSFYGLILVVAGAFIGFTSTSTLIDFDQRRIKFSNNFFGIIRIGNWINLEANMKLGIRKSDKVWRAYSRSNRTLDIEDMDFRIILFDSAGNPVLPLKKTESLASAKAELLLLSNQLGIQLI